MKPIREKEKFNMVELVDAAKCVKQQILLECVHECILNWFCDHNAPRKTRKVQCDLINRRNTYSVRFLSKFPIHNREQSILI